MEICEVFYLSSLLGLFQVAVHEHANITLYCWHNLKTGFLTTTTEFNRGKKKTHLLGVSKADIEMELLSAYQN